MKVSSSVVCWMKKWKEIEQSDELQEQNRVGISENEYNGMGQSGRRIKLWIAQCENECEGMEASTKKWKGIEEHVKGQKQVRSDIYV